MNNIEKEQLVKQKLVKQKLKELSLDHVKIQFYTGASNVEFLILDKVTFEVRDRIMAIYNSVFK